MDPQTIFDYVIRNFLICYDANEQIASINYGPANDKFRIDITPRIESSGIVVDFDQILWREWDGKSIPVLFGDRTEDNFYKTVGNRILFNDDLIASAFYFLSGWHEITDPHFDHLGRQTHKNSIQEKLGITELPVVNYYFDILKAALEDVCSVKINRRLWNGRPFSAVITHDIDKCNSGWLEGISPAIKKKRLFKPFELILKRLFGSDAWFNFDQILEFEATMNVKSTFFFLSRKGKYKGFDNADYRIASQRFKKVLKNIEKSGSEKGIHGSFGTHEDADLYLSDLQRLPFRPIGNRFHFLLFDIEKTVECLENSGISYDSTLGFAETIGFKNSICTPFFLFDHGDEKCSNVLEIALNVMDTTLQHTKYLNLKPDEATDRVIPLIDEIKKHGGIFTILWHNTFYSDVKYAGWPMVINDVISYCKGKDAMFTTGSDINEIVRTRLTDRIDEYPAA